MKVFILGLAKSGRTTLAKSLADASSIRYISAVDWVMATFRDRKDKEDLQDYEKAELDYISGRLTINPELFVDNIKDIIKVNDSCSSFIIDGVVSPRDFCSLFDYTKDIAIFLNRTDNPATPSDSDGISQNIIRDYCLWLTTMNLLSKDRWWEFNYRLPGEESDFIKELISRNHVTITKSFNKTISVIKERLCKFKM